MLTLARCAGAWAAALQWAQSDPFSRSHHITTSGFQSMLMLMHVCERVALFGFSGPQAREWYYEGGGLIPTEDARRSWEVRGQASETQCS